MSTIFPDHPLERFQQQVRRSARHIVWLGVALIVIGVGALAFPVVSTLVTTLFIGWLLVLSGLATALGAFTIRGTGPFFGALLVGLLSLAAGVLMLVRPVGGELAITLTLGFLAFELRPARNWGWMLVSALASVLLAIAIITGLPGVSLIALGVIIGVNFVTSGAGYVLIGMAMRRDL